MKFSTVFIMLAAFVDVTQGNEVRTTYAKATAIATATAKPVYVYRPTTAVKQYKPVKKEHMPIVVSKDYKKGSKPQITIVKKDDPEITIVSPSVPKESGTPTPGPTETVPVVPNTPNDPTSPTPTTVPEEGAPPVPGAPNTAANPITPTPMSSPEDSTPPVIPDTPTNPEAPQPAPGPTSGPQETVPTDVDSVTPLQEQEPTTPLGPESAECTDISPDAEYTCEEQKVNGRCEEPSIVDGGFCQQTCARC
eukprot:TRINITY_DN181_c0_g1_i3.p2 TRINITY_DN181_c0_g1~~TRINITY_DN181_c0_g1_i3.p2  ORF type:complete len:250 (-),score=47.03 TRINITY_DN181_c0_g1_i3:341-1090(-)